MKILTTDKRNLTRYEILLKIIKDLYTDTENMLSKFEFSRTKEKSTVICTIHGEYQQSLYRLSKGWGCIRCSAAKAAHEIHSINLKDIKYDKFGITIDDSRDIKVTLNSIITYKCEEHGTFEDIVDKIKRKINFCPSCDSNVYSIDNWIASCNKNHDNKYDYSLITEMSGCTDKVQIICPIHGLFTQKAADHKYGLGCRKCGHINTGLLNSINLKGRQASAESKLNQSITIKRKILEGSFTPCVTNSWARSRCYIDNIPFRSSWEAMFYLTSKLPFEKIRIPYISIDSKQHSYIIDFHDEKNKILYEIKPNGNKIDEIVILKEKAALNWCLLNGWSYVFIDEDYLNTNIEIIERELKICNADERTNELINKYIKRFK